MDRATFPKAVEYLLGLETISPGVTWISSSTHIAFFPPSCVRILLQNTTLSSEGNRGLFGIKRTSPTSPNVAVTFSKDSQDFARTTVYVDLKGCG